MICFAARKNRNRIEKCLLATSRRRSRMDASVGNVVLDLDLVVVEEERDIHLLERRRESGVKKNSAKYDMRRTLWAPRQDETCACYTNHGLISQHLQRSSPMDHVYICQYTKLYVPVHNTHTWFISRWARLPVHHELIILMGYAYQAPIPINLHPMSLHPHMPCKWIPLMNCACNVFMPTSSPCFHELTDHVYQSVWIMIVAR